MDVLAEFFLAEKEQPQKTRFEKKCKDTFHRERLPNNAAGKPGKCRPIRSELEFHRYPRYNPDGKVEREYFSPKSRGVIVALLLCFLRKKFKDDDEERKPHRKLGEDVVECYRKSELQTVDKQCITHGLSFLY